MTDSKGKLKELLDNLVEESKSKGLTINSENIECMGYCKSDCGKGNRNQSMNRNMKPRKILRDKNAKMFHRKKKEIWQLM